jgi:uncharacterized RDD family membrane protein YckC
MQGHYAGFFSRTAAFGIDVVAIIILFAVVGSVIEYLVTAISGHTFSFSEAPVASDVVLAALAFIYFAYPLAMRGRTLGMAVLGLRVVRSDGTDLDGRHAVIRVLALPLSFLLLGIGILMILVQRQRRALHDLIGDTAVVYWDPSPELVIEETD